MRESEKKFLSILVYFALAATTAAVYWQVKNFDFVNFDDNEYIYQNPRVFNGLTTASIVWAFTTGHAANWHPLTWLSLMLDCQFLGPNPGWMHFVNVLLHIANTLLLFAVLKKMTASLWPSAFVAAAFALHPMHVESVAWITERKDVLSTFFWILTMFAYVKYVKRRTPFSYLLTLLLFALGLMAKPMLVTLPFVLLLLDYWPLNRLLPRTIAAAGAGRSAAKAADERSTLSRLLIEKIPFFALSLISCVITFVVQRSGLLVLSIDILPLNYRFANVLLSYVRYMGKMFWPYDLAIFYPGHVSDFTFWRIVFCVLLLLAVSAFVIRFGRNRRYLPVGWFWFVGTLIPVIGFVQVADQALADRYTYIPYIGLFIMIAWGLPELFSRWPHRKLILGISMAVVLTVLAICAGRQVGYWNNSVTLFSHAVAVTQHNYFAYNNLGAAYYKRGRYEESIEAFRRAIEIKPNYTEAYYNLGNICYKLGQYEESIEAFKHAVRIQPTYAWAHYNLGVALRTQGKTDEAITELTKAVQLMPDYAYAHSSLGAILLKKGNLADAAIQFREAERLKPDLAAALLDRAAALVREGRLSEACDEYRAVLMVKPNWLPPMNDLAWILATSPDPNVCNPTEAIRIAQKACVATNYKEAGMLDTLGAAYASAGRFSDAVATAQKAITLAVDANQPRLKEVINRHLSFYMQGKPYVEYPLRPSASN